MEEGGAVGAELPKPAQEAGKQSQSQATLYVGNLAPEASEDQLGAIFAMLQPTQLKIMRDKVSGERLPPGPASNETRPGMQASSSRAIITVPSFMTAVQA